MNNKKALIAIAIVLGSAVLGWLLTYGYYASTPQEYVLPDVEVSNQQSLQK
jgi:hypothetical protein